MSNPLIVYAQTLPITELFVRLNASAPDFSGIDLGMASNRMGEALKDLPYEQRLIVATFFLLAEMGVQPGDLRGN